METHQEIGQRQQLFFASPLSAGSPFFLPNGTFIYNKLKKYLREKYHQYGYKEVITPTIAHADLWKKSGHYDKYKENMFLFKINNKDTQEFGLKGMNCPMHCEMIKKLNLEADNLPMRFADFGALHRNENSGSLTGLTRVRKFCQDDAHIFCKKDDLSGEIQSILHFIDDFYALFGFSYKLEFSTRPEKYIGSLELWENAEQILKSELEKFSDDWEENPGDGAFYGPKIDVKICDSIGRYHQCATVQLDFNLPQRFDLKYVSDTGDSEYMIMIHRAILGSFERFIAILAEHTQGKWPFWLSPFQIEIVPISAANFDYAESVYKILYEYGLQARVDLSNKHFKEKIANAERVSTNHILVVGNKEVNTNGVNIRVGNVREFMLLDDYLNIVKDPDDIKVNYIEL